MKSLPEPSSFLVDPGSYRNNYYLTVTPYDSLNWCNVANLYGVRLPEIIDMTQGKSKCAGCNAIYTGFQPVCNARVIFHKSNAYHDERGYHPHYPSYEKECGGTLKWDLQNEFSVQKDFFSLLNRISTLPELSYDPLNKFRDHFPVGVPDALKVRMMSQDIEKLNLEMPQIKLAIKTIAEKMNSAGNHLSFGFLS